MRSNSEVLQRVNEVDKMVKNIGLRREHIFFQNVSTFLIAFATVGVSDLVGGNKSCHRVSKKNTPFNRQINDMSFWVIATPALY